MAAKLAVRRPTESSKGLSATKDRSLSSVTLTKKTYSLVTDVEDIKNHVKTRFRDVNRGVTTSADIYITQVSILQDAFNSLSDVFTLEIEDLQKKMTDEVTGLQTKIDQLEKQLAQLQHFTARIDGKRHQQHDQSEKNHMHLQEALSKITISLYETQAELGMVKNNTDQLMSREHESTRLLQSVQSSQEQAMEWLHKLRHESNQQQTDLCTTKEELSGSCVALGNDVQTLAKESAVLRSNWTQQNAQWAAKLEALRETIDRQSKMEKTQLTQRIDALSEALATYELRTKEAVNGLLKNHSRIRIAVDESMSICSSELKALGNECKKTQEEQQFRIEGMQEQFMAHATQCTKQWEELQFTARILRHQQLDG
ncbi:TPA: hypothetical protein N0F65_008375 [Lagenidium giganteum]|uniref:Uncharacterized protein n=1 Tax=Lagenidium giganteum TaxID=4803 RepID=A0AAV2YYE4_9STRA|nr:TPA: hypothetical protein N0F65_008375 [Lagenidium giganteum]